MRLTYYFNAGSEVWVHVTSRHDGRLIFAHAYPLSIWRRIAGYVIAEVRALQSIGRGANPSEYLSYGRVRGAESITHD